jgi:uncharacterized protein
MSDVRTGLRREPFYFGAPDKQLFGCGHASASGLIRDCGVVLCYPMGQEYIRAHRAFLQLADRLSGHGFPVVRFDYHGCGDSAGACEEGRVAQWRADIYTAIEEIRKRYGVAKVCLVGLRLGGSLAMAAAAERGEIDALVLWNPIVCGRAYRDELNTMQQEMLRFSYVTRAPRVAGPTPVEILGFPLARETWDELGAIDLLATPTAPARRVLLLESDRERGTGLQEHLSGLGAEVDYQYLPSPKVWVEEPNRGLVPHQLLQAIIAWVLKVNT